MVARTFPTSFPGAATLRGPGIGWILPDDGRLESLGSALAWARREGLTRLRILVDGDAGALARRARAFAPPPEVFEIRGRSVHPARPDPPPRSPPAPEGLARFVEMIRAAGADAVIEGSVLQAEVLGLEVGRVTEVEGEHVLEVGVGRYDREAHRLVHSGADAMATLRDAVAEVRRHRLPDVPSHPANQLAPERWLRALLVSQPEAAGARMLAPFAVGSARHGPPAPGERDPAPALGRAHDGEAVLVVCSTGVDLDLVPAAADMLATAAASTPSRRPRRLVLALPEGDDVPLTRGLASWLAQPAEVRTVPRDWKGALAGSR